MLNLSKKTLIPFLMAGYPDIESSERLISSIIEAGASVIEIGVPFSDPVADGPSIQKASAVSVRQGIRLVDVLGLVRRLKDRHPDVEIVLFTYLNPILKLGLDGYAAKAVCAGVSATLIVDLPPEEAGPYLDAHQQVGLKTVFLVAPTTSATRMRQIANVSSGFVYYVSRAGVTGAQHQISQSLSKEVAVLREVTQKPIAIGFGISSLAQILEVSQYANGIVVGSHLLNIIDQSGNLPTAEAGLRVFIKSALDMLSGFSAEIGRS